jgi:hypothetical protein
LLKGTPRAVPDICRHGCVRVGPIWGGEIEDEGRRREEAVRGGCRGGARGVGSVVVAANAEERRRGSFRRASLVGGKPVEVAAEQSLPGMESMAFVAAGALPRRRCWTRCWRAARE